MRVRAAWSGETASGWRKADVDCDETDLDRLGRAFGFDKDTITNTEAFRLLDVEANLMLLTSILARFGQGLPNEYFTEQQELVARKQEIVKAIRETPRSP